MKYKRLVIVGILILVTSFMLVFLRHKCVSYSDGKVSGIWFETSSGMISIIKDKPLGIQYVGFYIGSDRTCCHFAIGYNHNNRLIFQLFNPCSKKMIYLH